MTLKCKRCKKLKKCVNFAGYPARANDNICPYYEQKKKKEKNKNDKQN